MPSPVVPPPWPGVFTGCDAAADLDALRECCGKEHLKFHNIPARPPLPGRRGRGRGPEGAGTSPLPSRPRRSHRPRRRLRRARRGRTPCPYADGGPCVPRCPADGRIRPSAGTPRSRSSAPRRDTVERAGASRPSEKRPPRPLASRAGGGVAGGAVERTAEFPVRTAMSATGPGAVFPRRRGSPRSSGPPSRPHRGGGRPVVRARDDRRAAPAKHRPPPSTRGAAAPCRGVRRRRPGRVPCPPVPGRGVEEEGLLVVPRRAPGPGPRAVAGGR
ncbi:hypothetical protein FHS37_003132 [Streptomyces griseostramineus]|uniref:Uncharacterized protein n=1 Tax=Streptomyces griseomycini TaxID=66895 RepID=A0A7W7PR01_9ACTN|nr:hypothetical protein [Streptomyces griseomycini]